MTEPGVFVHPREVRFGECDPAGVVYFPRFFEWFHEAMEAWFGQALGRPYAEVLQEYGFPAVESQAQFKAPCRLGERLDIEVRVLRLGRSSFTLGYTVRGEDGDLRAEGHTAAAMIVVIPGVGGQFKAVRIPPDLRARIEAFMGGGPEAA